MEENLKNKNIMITYTQIKRIHILKNIIGLNDKTYRDMLSSFEVYSSKYLTEAEADIFISALEYEANKRNKIYYKKFEDLNSRDENMATPAQLRKIEVLWKDICNSNDLSYRKKTLRLYFRKKFRIDDIRFLTKKRASVIIPILEKIRKNKFLKAI